MIKSQVFPRYSLIAAIVACSAVCLTNASAATVNGFANGGFELAGTTTPAESWIVAAEGYTLTTDARTGNFAAQLMSPTTNAAVFLQNSVNDGLMAPLIEGDNPLLSFWSKGFAGTTGNVLFGLRYLASNGVILSNGGRQFQSEINPTTWTEITFDLGAVPAGAESAFIEFSQAIGPIDGVNNLAGTVLIDDVRLSVAAVPEPGSCFAIAIGVAGFVRYRRRR